MRETSTSLWRTEDHLREPEDVAAYLEAAFDDGDPELIRHALAVIAKSRGMKDVARQAGLAEHSLDEALSSKGQPEFTTVVQIVRALGLKLSVTPA